MKPKKSRFIGVRLTAKQEKLLLRLEQTHGYKTHSGALLSGLESLASSSSLSRTQEWQIQQEVMSRMIPVVSKSDEIVDRYHQDESALIQILLDIQQEYNWLPKEALLWLSQRLGVPLHRVYHIASFYKAFSLVPRGRHIVKVCTGTACHVRGGDDVVNQGRATAGH